MEKRGKDRGKWYGEDIEGTPKNSKKIGGLGVS